MKEFAGIIRLPFLLLAPVCVFLAAGLAYSMTGELDWGLLLIILFGAISAHIGVNALNEYQDFISGLDLQTERTPFSGGSGTLPENSHLAPLALRISISAIVFTSISGLVLIYLRGSELLLPGLSGLVLIVLYTKILNRYPLLCLLSPGLGFGIIMVGGSYLALTGSYSNEVFLVSLIPFFLVNNLLLLNQFPDVSADRKAGRRHILIQYGYKAASLVYLIFLLFAALTLIASVYLGILPLYSLSGLLLIAVGVPVYQAAANTGSNIDLLLPHMGTNVGMVLLIPVLLGISLFYNYFKGVFG
jgi:1,4-dihydroxy-2-naphthoate polyprenyltransferase